MDEFQYGGTRCLHLLIVTPFWRTLRARNHVTPVQYFQIYYVAIILDAYNFSSFFFLARVFGNFHFFPRCLPLLLFDLLALNLEFELDIREEFFLTWYRDPGCQRSLSEQGFHSFFVEK